MIAKKQKRLTLTAMTSLPKPTLLSLPTEVIQKILIHLLHPNPSCTNFTTAITPTNEETFTDLYHVDSLKPHLRRTVDSVNIDWTSTISPRTLETLSSGISTLSVSRHRLAAAYIDALDHTSLQSLTLVDVTLPPFLYSLVTTARNLKHLSLSFCTTTIESVPCLNLETLKLSGITGLTHHPLVSLLSPTLTSLHLSYLRDASINDRTLISISECKNLTQLTLSHLRQCSPTAVTSLLRKLPHINALTLVATSISASDLSNYLTTANLSHLSLEEPTWSVQNTEFFLRNLSNPLKSFELRDVPGVSDLDVRRIVNRMHGLTALSLRRHPLLTVFSAIFISTLRVKSLNLRGVLLSDKALTFLSHPSLHEVSLGGDGQLLPLMLADCIAQISNTGMEKFLKKSPNLKRFFWESPRAFHHTGSGGPDRLTARSLAIMLQRFCNDLEHVEVNWLRPRGTGMQAKADAARCDLAFLELEEATGAVIVVDERPLY